MSPGVEQNVVRFPPSVLEEPGQNLRFMHRRRVSKIDRNGDPLDGVVNLFTVAIILAVGFLLAALASFGLSDVLSSKNMTIVKNPGAADMQVILKRGSTIQSLDLHAGQQVSGVGTLIGQFYRLQDGSTVYLPASGAPTPGAAPGVTPTPGAPGTPTPSPTTASP
jgi:hypothetical protein